MSAKWGDSLRERTALDNWIAGIRGYDWCGTHRLDEHDPTCECGLKWTDHPTVYRMDEDGIDYETQVCGPNTVLAGTLVSDIPNGQGGPQ